MLDENLLIIKHNLEILQ